MPFQKGNKKAKGHGRKSAYQEMADAAYLHKTFFNIHDLNALEKRVKSRKYSIFDAMVIKALQGSESAFIAIFKKIYPDGIKMNVESPQITETISLLQQILDGDKKSDKTI